LSIAGAAGDQGGSPAPWWEWRTRASVWGLPLVHVAFGYRSRWRPYHARGVIAVGQYAVGVVAIGQFAAGVVSVSQAGAGVVALGQFVVAAVGLAQFGIVLDGAGPFVWALGPIAAAILAWPRDGGRKPHPMGGARHPRVPSSPARGRGPQRAPSTGRAARKTRGHEDEA
jgi:hypothetical protein